MRKRRMLGAGLAITMMLMAACGSTVSKDTEEPERKTFESVGEDWPVAESFAGGDGTEESPYEISSAEELALLASYVNNKDDRDTQKEYNSACYRLTADIELNDTSDFEKWAKTQPKYRWNPIGNGNYYASFEGKFLGEGHTISGLYINIAEEGVSDSEAPNYYIGLFGRVNDGVIRDVMLEDSYIHLSGQVNSAGGIVGCTYATKIMGCSNYADIETITNSGVGGIVGAGNGDSSIKDCKNFGQMKYTGISGNCGGIAGYFPGVISNCENKGTIIGDDGAGIGGIAGTGGDISHCSNFGEVMIEGKAGVGTEAGGIVGTSGSVREKSEIIDCHNEGKVRGQIEFAGGIVGRAGAGLDLADNPDKIVGEFYITDCTNKADIVCKDGSNIAGGIVGDLRSTKGAVAAVRGCTNYGDIIGKESLVAGGISGGPIIDYRGTMKFEDCVNEGKISSDSGQIGGILGLLMQTTEEGDDGRVLYISRCQNKGEVDGNAYGVGGIIGMGTILSFEGDDFLIDICVNEGSVTNHAPGQAGTGGIIGNLSLGEGKGEIRKSSNAGVVVVDAGTMSDEDLDLIKSEGLGSAMGGIGGTVPKSLIVTDCSNTGELTVIGDENAKQTVHINEEMGLVY